MTLAKLKQPTPAEQIFERIKNILPHVEIGNEKVLLVIYVRPTAKDLGGGKVLYSAPVTQKEDVLQGKAGLVVKVGPVVSAKDKVRGFSIEVGDWVAVNASDGWSMNMGPPNDMIYLRLLNEQSIHMKISEPSIIW